METLAKRAKSRRLALELNQAKVAELSGLKQSDISKIENGLILKTTGLVALAKALRCDPEWLATGEGRVTTDRVWPFASVTPEQLQSLSPKALEAIEKTALSLLEIEQRHVSAPSQPDTVVAPRSKGFGGTQKKPTFAKGPRAQRSTDQRTPRKTGNG